MNKSTLVVLYVLYWCTFFTGVLRAETSEWNSQEKQPQHGTHPGPRLSMTFEDLTAFGGVSGTEADAELLKSGLDSLARVTTKDSV